LAARATVPKLWWRLLKARFAQSELSAEAVKTNNGRARQRAVVIRKFMAISPWFPCRLVGLLSTTGFLLLESDHSVFQFDTACLRTCQRQGVKQNRPMQTLASQVNPGHKAGLYVPKNSTGSPVVRMFGQKSSRVHLRRPKPHPLAAWACFLG
jgi:hypothetical protein